MTRFLDMRIEAIEFLIHIDFLRKDRDFLLKTSGVERLLQITDSIHHPLAQCGSDFWHPLTNLGGPFAHSLEPFQQHQLGGFTLSLPGGSQLIGGLVHQLERCLVQWPWIRELFLDNARPPHQVGYGGWRIDLCGCSQFDLQFKQAIDQGSVEVQPARTPAGRRLKSQRAIDFAAADGVPKSLSQFRFERPEFLWHPEADFEIPVIDRAYLPTEAAKIILLFDAGKAGHAANHFLFPHGRQWHNGNGLLPRLKPAASCFFINSTAARQVLMRPSGRQADEMRTVSFERNVNRHAEGSVLISCGETRVMCLASVEERVPPFLRNSGEGWVTAEYGMLPRSTGTRMRREASQGRQGGRTLEIQRLIGRSLRAVVDRSALGERTITVDCDVLQADGGTRTASITGAYVALAQACQGLLREGRLKRDPIHGQVAAISVGIFEATPVLDLDYAEDHVAETDMNVVMNDGGAFIELQGTAEGHAFRRSELDRLLELAGIGIEQLLAAQRDALTG